MRSTSGPCNQLQAAGQNFTDDNLLLSAPIRREGLPPAVLRCLRAARAPNTLRAYADDIAAFLRSGGSLPCTDAAQAAFLASGATHWAPSTLARRLAGIGFAHRQLGLADPTGSPLVREVMRGLRRLHGRPPRQAQPITPQELDAALREPTDTRARRDRALLLLGFASGLRRAELVALDVADLTWTEQGLTLHVRAGKTDPARQGRRVAIAVRPGDACAVRAVRDWLDHAGVEEGAVFRAVDKAGQASAGRLSPGAVAIIVKRYAARLGHDPAAVSGHSLRAGFVSSAARAGIPLHEIQQQTGHRSLAMLGRYIRAADPFEGTRRLWAAGTREECAALPANLDSEEAILGAAAAILKRRLERQGALSRPEDAADFLRMRLAGLPHEVFFVVYLDTRHRIIAAEPAFTGTIDQAEVHPRVIAKRALALNAAALICAHNHPSGITEPSAADRALTERLKQALQLVDVRLLDHFVVTAGEWASLSARGWV